MTHRHRSPVFKIARLIPLVRRVAKRSPLPAGAAKRWLFFQLARRFTPVIVSQESDGAQFLVRTSDAVVGEQLFIYGGSDDREVLKRAFAVIDPGPEHTDQRVPGERVLLEIGANIGTTTITALRDGYVDRVVAIEAHPETARLLAQNAIANCVAKRVRVINAAVTDSVGAVELALSDVDSGDHRVCPRQARQADDLASRSRLTVPGTTVDALVREGTVKLDETPLVWIDAQGHEPVILRGAKSLLASGVPVLIEYWPQGLWSSGGLESLEQIVASNYARFVDLRVSADPQAARPAAELPALRQSYTDGSFTDLLLLKN